MSGTGKAREAGRTWPGERNAGACLARDGWRWLPDLARGAKLVEALVRTQGITLCPLRPAERGRNGYTCESARYLCGTRAILLRSVCPIHCYAGEIRGGGRGDGIAYSVQRLRRGAE